MALTQKQKKDIITEHGRNEKDTGSAETQIAMLTTRIVELTEHLKENPKDFSCKRGLTTMVGRRRRLQAYYKSKCTPEEYKELITKLKLRR